MGQRRSGFGLSLTQAEIGCTMVLLILMIITIGYNGGCSTALPPHYLKIIDPNIITDTYTEVTCLSRGWATGSVIASPWTIWCRHQSPLFAPFFILQKKEDRRSRSPFGAIAYPPEKQNKKGRVFSLHNIIFLLFHSPHLLLHQQAFRPKSVQKYITLTVLYP